MTTTMMAPEMTSEKLNVKLTEYLMAWREIWLDHVYWTRLAEISIIHNVPGLEQTEKRLLRNVDDMLGLMEPEYGRVALEPLRTLLRDHLLIAAKLVTEARDGSPYAEQTEKDWYQNADEISKFLSAANPYLPYQDVKDMFFDHLAKTKAEAVYQLTGDWDGDIANWEDIETMGLMMANAFGVAISKQFPEKFS
jgi:hypothetical protein